MVQIANFRQFAIFCKARSYQRFWRSEVQLYSQNRFTHIYSLFTHTDRLLSNNNGRLKSTLQTKDFVDSIQKGATIKDKGYVSTATKSISEIFMQYADDALEGYGVILRIKLPKGTKAIIERDECLLPRDSELKINNVQYIDGVRVADAEYVLPNSQE